MAENKNAALSFIGGIVLTLILVVGVPILISLFIEDFVMDLLGASAKDSIGVGIVSGSVGGIVMLIILVIFMMLFGGGKILKKFGVIGIIGLIVAYVFLLKQTWGWVIPVLIVILLFFVSVIRDRKK